MKYRFGGIGKEPPNFKPLGMPASKIAQQAASKYRFKYPKPQAGSITSMA